MTCFALSTETPKLKKGESWSWVAATPRSTPATSPTCQWQRRGTGRSRWMGELHFKCFCNNFVVVVHSGSQSNPCWILEKCMYYLVCTSAVAFVEILVSVTMCACVSVYSLMNLKRCIYSVCLWLFLCFFCYTLFGCGLHHLHEWRHDSTADRTGLIIF